MTAMIMVMRAMMMIMMAGEEKEEVRLIFRVLNRRNSE